MREEREVRVVEGDAGDIRERLEDVVEEDDVEVLPKDELVRPLDEHHDGTHAGPRRDEGRLEVFARVEGADLDQGLSG